MDYNQAVVLAKAGDERGFNFLYENTYKSKYYLALRYMKDEEAAKDVLQDAYIKAFGKLDTLSSPEAFPSWLGQIVANTAKNMLVKNNPMLFSDVAVDDEGESFEYQIEDDNIDVQPEIAYTRKETQELVYELMDSLSEEQRLCILMFHIEGASISEIAQTLNCSENTVKSRLNYGRKNIKIKAEELQKKGYKLYSIAPLPLLLFLLRSDEKAILADSSLDAIYSQLKEQIMSKVLKHGKGATAGGASQAAKTGFIHTVAGKVTIVVAGICIAGGAAVSGYQLLANNSEEVQEEEQAPEDESTPEDEPAQLTTKEEIKTSIKDDEYPQYIAGNLSKEELQFVLAYGPEELTDLGLVQSDYNMILINFCGAGESAENYIEDYGIDENYLHHYSVADVNRLIYSFSDYQYPQGFNESGISVDGSIIKFVPATLSYDIMATITDTKLSDEELEIDYTFEKVSYELGTTTTNKRAILKPIADGTYRIVTIEDVQGEQEETTQAAEQTTDVGNTSVRELYQGVLQSVQNGEASDKFSVSGLTGEYKYFVADINGDGVKELIVGAVYTENVFMGYDIKVYGCENVGAGYQLKEISEDKPVISLVVAADGNGLFEITFSRGTGETEAYRITIDTGVLVTGSVPEQRFIMGDDSYNAFYDMNLVPEWLDCTDVQGLDDLE